jgi:hypothetical protein
MIASKSCLRHYLFFLPRELRNLRVFVLFLSINENNNGFDLIGMNSFLLDYRRLVYFFILLLYLALFSLVAYFRLDEMFAF